VCEKEGGDRGNNTVSVIVSVDERTRMAMVQRLPQKGSPGMWKDRDNHLETLRPTLSEP
jgi:hypothetical protein